MYNNLDDLPQDYDEDLKHLEMQISELFALLERSEIQINLLKDENFQLKAQIQKLQQQSKPVQYKNNQAETIKVPKENITTISPSGANVRQNKRKCPNCGAAGFSIKEVYDKTRIITYVPSRIYMKKKVCTKCRFEF